MFTETSASVVVLNAFHNSWEPFFTGSIPQWIEKHIELRPPRFSITGPVDLSRSKYLIQPLLSLQNPFIRQVNVLGPIQAGKSLISSLWATYLVSNSEGTMLRLTQTQTMAERMVDTEFMPILKSNGIIEKYMPKASRKDITRNNIYFPHFNIHIDSAKESVLQSLTIKYLTMDEVFLMENGMIAEAKNRTAAFPYNKKILLTSVAGNDTDEWTTEFQAGIVHEWAWICPKCNKAQLFNWFKKLEDGSKVGMVYDTIEKEGKINILKTAKTARMVCEHCKEPYANTPTNRRLLNDSGKYIVTKADGNEKVHSFHFSSLASIDCSYEDLAVEYLTAKENLKQSGDLTKLSEFQRMKMSVPWVTKHQIQIQDILSENYNPAEAWGDYTFMTIDCQALFTEFFYVIRSWKKTGESRLKAFGRAPDFVTLRKIQIDAGIRDQCCALDSGYNATQCYGKAIEYSHIGLVKGKKIQLGWICLKGSPWIDFSHTDGSKKLYSTEARGDPAMGKSVSTGKTAPLYRWSSPSVQDILTHLRDQKGVSWSVPDALKTEEYVKQLNSHYRTFVTDKKNKPVATYLQKTGVADHWWDCESMQVVMAIMCGCIGNAFQTTPKD